MPSRKKMPSSFVADHVRDCLRSCVGVLASDMARVKASPSDRIFTVNFECTQDKEALLKYQELITSLLLRNPTGIFKKMVLLNGFLGERVMLEKRKQFITK